MSIRIRPADIVTDRHLIIDVLARFLTPLSNAARFDWLYRDSVYGKPQTWIAIDNDDDEVIGVASAFPRRWYMNNGERNGWVLGDFCVSSRHRSLGPALQLLRASIGGVSENKEDFFYDFPSQAMMAVYKRLRVETCGRMVRFAKLLHADRKVREHSSLPIVTVGVSAVANWVLRLHDRIPMKQGTITVDLQRDVCGEEFSRLASDVGSRYGAYIQRSATYVNWRYVRNPLAQYEILTARQKGRLTAYAVFVQVGRDAVVADLFGVYDENVLQSLLLSLSQLLRGRGVQTVSVPVWEAHPWIPRLSAAGFSARETSPVVVSSSFWDTNEREEHPAWMLMHGDRDS